MLNLTIKAEENLTIPLLIKNLPHQFPNSKIYLLEIDNIEDVSVFVDKGDNSLFLTIKGVIR